MLKVSVNFSNNLKVRMQMRHLGSCSILKNSLVKVYYCPIILMERSQHFTMLIRHIVHLQENQWLVTSFVSNLNLLIVLVSYGLSQKKNHILKLCVRNITILDWRRCFSVPCTISMWRHDLNA